MTDKQKLVALFDEFGIEWRENKELNYVFCESGCNKVDAYDGFYTGFLFNSVGKFIEMEIKEP